MWPKQTLKSLLKPREAVDLKQVGAAAGVLMDNPAYQNAREEILRGIVEKWLGSNPDAVGERESLFIQAYALQQIDGQLKLAVVQSLMKGDNK